MHRARAFFFVCTGLVVLEFLLPGRSAAAWPSDPLVNVPLCTATGWQNYPTIVSDGAGGAIVTWQDTRNGNVDIYAQRVNAAGLPQWTANGVALCTATGNQQYPTIVSDGAGGAIVTWQDQRSVTNNDIYAQRVNATGVPQWTANGVALCTATRDQGHPTIVSDGASGAIVTWADFRSGANQDIYAQRVSAGGAVQWAANGVVLCTATGQQESTSILSDGGGGAIVAWHDYRSGSTSDIYAQRVSAGGAVQWAANGVAICTAAADQLNYSLVSDGAGGAIVPWYDGRSGTNYDIYVQRVSAGGAVQWAADGVPLCTATDDQRDQAIVADGAGGAIVTWNDYRTGGYYTSDIYAQRVNAAGGPQWTADGVALCSAANSQLNPTIVADGAGGAIVTWQDQRSGTNYDIYAQRVSAGGSVQWTAGGVPLCTAATSQSPQLITSASDGAGGAIVTWDDGRGGNYDIYAQQVNAGGLLGGPPAQTITASPGPHGSITPSGAVFVAFGADQTFTITPNACYSIADVLVDGSSVGAVSSYSFLDVAADHTIAASFAYNGSQPQDADGDGLSDEWETLGVPIVGDPSGRYLLPGANPQHKDLYVEVDAMTGKAPDQVDLQRVVDAFNNASTVCNPDEHTGIHLHIVGARGCDPCVDDSNLPAASWADPPWPEVHALKAVWFGTGAERTAGGVLPAPVAEARALAFRYCIFGDNFSRPNSGWREPNADNLVVTMGPISNVDSNKRAGTFMHELGHSLGLGGDNYNPNYFSVMSYLWQWPANPDFYGFSRPDMEGYRDSWRLDYSNARLNQLDEGALDERSGIGGDATRVVPVGPPRLIEEIRWWPTLVPMGGPVDWNRDGHADDTGVIRDINWMHRDSAPSPGEVLEPVDDWNSLRYATVASLTRPTGAPRLFVDIADDNVEMTQAIYDSLCSLRFDCNDNNVPDDEEVASGAVADVNGNGIPDECESPAINVAVGEGPPSPSRLSMVLAARGAAHEIRYSLPVRAQTRLRIFDLAGRAVVTLTDGDAPAGVYRVVWGHVDAGGQGVSSGVYFVELQSGNRRAQGKIVVLR